MDNSQSSDNQSEIFYSPNIILDLQSASIYCKKWHPGRKLIMKWSCFFENLYSCFTPLGSPGFAFCSNDLHFLVPRVSCWKVFAAHLFPVTVIIVIRGDGEEVIDNTGNDIAEKRRHLWLQKKCGNNKGEEKGGRNEYHLPFSDPDSLLNSFCLPLLWLSLPPPSPPYPPPPPPPPQRP